MKSIDFRVMYCQILYPSLSHLALWIEHIVVKVEIMGWSLTTYNILKKIKSLFIIHHVHDLHDFYKTYV